MKDNNEKGEVVVEASIIVTIVVICITIMLYVGMILYQQTVVTVMANQTASNIAQIYNNNLKDPFTGYVDSEHVYQSITYDNMKTEAYMSVIEQKANVFAKYRLKSSTILTTGTTSVDIDIVKKPNELLKSQVVVTIHDRYDVPLVSIFGSNGAIEFAASGRADCVDILEYINGVEAIGDPEESNVSFLPDSDNCVITFVPDRSNPSNSSTVTVLRGRSVLSSNRYTHSVMPKNPTIGTLEFDGWIDSSNQSFTAATVVNENLVVYGAWKCSVTLNADGGTVCSDNTYSFKVRIGTRCTIPDAIRSGYNFSGWYTQKNGVGIRYLSNDTPISDNVILYASWSCAHPSRYEASRDGNVCMGGTINYKCTQCDAHLGVGYYGGTGHSWTARCNIRHILNWFDGRNVAGGCGGYHSYPAYSFCYVCENCSELREGYNWCANSHVLGTTGSKPRRYPSKHNYYRLGGDEY